MEPTQIQLLLNVVTITGATSLAGYCYLLKKENRRLATQKETRKETPLESPKPEVAPPVVYLQTVSSVTAESPVTVKEDIRNFAAGRRKRWVNQMVEVTS